MTYGKVAVAVMFLTQVVWAQTVTTCEQQSTIHDTALTHWYKTLEHVNGGHQFAWFWENTCDYTTVQPTNGFPCEVDQTAHAEFPPAQKVESGLINTAPTRYHYITTKTQVAQAHSPDNATSINAGAGGGAISCLVASGCGPFQVSVPPFTIVNASVVEDSGTLTYNDTCVRKTYLIHQKSCPCAQCGCGSPLMLNMDPKAASGIDISQFTSVDSGILFKLKRTDASWETTEPQHIAWTKPGSLMAVLVLPTEDGRIETSEQLFGNWTSCGRERCANGFAALAYKCDRPKAGGNNDGVCDSRDALWLRLRWLLGTPDDGKLYTMAEMHVMGISVTDYHKLDGKYLLEDQYGNQFWYQGVADMGIRDLGNGGFQTNYRDMYDVNLRDEFTKR